MKQVRQGRTIHRHKTMAMLRSLQENKNIGDALLVFFAALFLLSAFEFYPLPVIFVLALAAGAVAYKFAPFGTLAALFLAFPAVAYQSPVFAWIPYSLIIAMAMFEVFENWHIIAILSILVLAPFAPFPVSLLSGFVYLAMALSALFVGSKRSVLISIPSIFLVLLLSTVWQADNSAFMPVTHSNYGAPIELLKNNRLNAPDFLNLVPEGINAIMNLFDTRIITSIGEALNLVLNNTIILFTQDSAFLQLAIWAIALYIIGYLPGRVKFKKKQTIASLSLLTIPPVYYLISQIYGTQFQYEMIVYILLSIAAIFLLEHFNINLSRERVLMRKEKAKAFGKFGVQDMLEGESVDMNQIGGYGDVKSELKESIIWPLREKDLSYTYGIKPPNGILLFGPPGTGKTLLMRALAKELDVGFYYVKASELLSEWYGESLPYDEELLISQNGKARPEKIGKIVEEKMNCEVLSFDENGKGRFSKIKDHIKHKCTSPIYEVKTRTGRRIKVTDYHSLFALNGGKVESIPTSQLTPKKSFIAVPSKIEFSRSPLEKINFLSSLSENDHNLWVKGATEYLSKAEEKLGIEKTASILGINRKRYFRQILKNGTGVRAGKFLSLMDEAKIHFNPSKLRIYSGKNSLPGEMEIDEQLSHFLGLWVAEGSYNRKDTVRISTSAGEEEHITKLCKGLFGNITLYKKKNSKGRDIYIGSRPLYVLMRHTIGLDHGARKKSIPRIAFSLSRNNMAAFLRGYFSGDGSIYTNQRNVGMVEASTASHGLASQLMYLLLYFGIVASVYDKKESNGHTAKRVCFSGSENMRKFGEIGFLDSVRSDRLGFCSHASKWQRSRQIPITGELRNSISRQMPHWSSSATAGSSMLMQFGGEEIEAEMQQAIESDMFFDRVEQITRVEDEEYVYDVSVDPCQNFAGGFGGIFAHNSEKNVAEIFSIARKNAPAILFFDEIDAVGKSRDSYSADDVAPRVMSTLLQELDGFKEKSGKQVIMVGATNVPHQLDSALMRPGRFDKLIYMHLPDEDAREEIFKVHTRKLPVEESVDFKKLSSMTTRYSGADIKNICTEVARLAAKEAVAQDAVVPLRMDHFKRVMKSIKPSTSLSKLDDYERFRIDFERRIGEEEEEEEGEETGVRWEDVAGLGKVKEFLLESIELPLLHEDLIKEYKIKPSKGLLLFGPPGCGKTLMVKAAANELKATFLTISGAELMKKGYQYSVEVIRDTFNRARENSPSIIFMDEIEAMAPNRDFRSGGAVAQLLTELDGIKELKGVMLIGATNKPWMLDPAIMRPGRFDKVVFIPPPDLDARKRIFELNLQSVMEPDIDLTEIAHLTEGFSGADIAAVCQDVKMGLVRERLKKGKKPNLTMKMLKGEVKERRPSITSKQLAEFFKFLKERGELEGEPPGPSGDEYMSQYR